MDKFVLINQGGESDFSVDENNIMRFRDRVCTPYMPELKSILEE